MPKLGIPNYVVTSITMSIGGLVNGLDTGSIGAIVSMKQFEKSIGHLSPSLLGFTVSLIMLTGGIPSVFAGYLADRFGRLHVILVGAVLFVLGAIVQGAARGLITLLIGRALGGFGEGIYLSNMGVYICEIAPVKRRGMLAGLPQFMSTAGVCIGYFICYGTVHIDSSMAWRIPYVFQAVLGAGLAIGTLVLPESPRWLILHGKRTIAVRALDRLDIPMAEAEKDILGVAQTGPSLSAWQSFTLLFRKGYRIRTMLALFILGMIQLSGIDGVLYYAPTLFSQAGLHGATASFLASGLSAILMLTISIPAFLLADKWGRRASAISGGLILSACMLLIGTLYAAGAVHSYGVARWVVIVSVFVFGLAYSSTWGIVGKIYASEIQPAHTRAAANCVAQGLGFFMNWVVAIITPIFLAKSAFGAYFLFGFLALGTVAVLAATMPETRGRSLENIQEAFQTPFMNSWSHLLRRWVARDANRNSSRHSSIEGYELESVRTDGVNTSSSIETRHAMRVEFK
ncbi:general substrate transporter [Tothia fuscella]|uniref:General substrate transporter n=1 Tax=Tothia fuscella TaxID=1048955 RepID=A0A9P4NU16_9PEZI|nr:general substrate transporter [Tothia fuscella]